MSRMLLNVKSLHLVKSYACEQWRGNIYSVFKSRRIILLEQGMTLNRGVVGSCGWSILWCLGDPHVWVISAFWNSLVLSFKILLWWLSGEIAPFGPKGQQMLSVWRSGMIKLWMHQFAPWLTAYMLYSLSFSRKSHPICAWEVPSSTLRVKRVQPFIAGCPREVKRGMSSKRSP